MTFVGSTKVGKLVMRHAAESLTEVSLILTLTLTLTLTLALTLTLIWPLT